MLVDRRRRCSSRASGGMQQVDAGFRADGILKAEYQLPPSRYPVDFRRFPDFKEMHAFTHGAARRAAALPGVEAVGDRRQPPARSRASPTRSGSSGREAEAATQPEISVRRVTPGYFRTVGVPLVRGRLLADSDRRRARAGRRSSTRRRRAASSPNAGAARQADQLLGRAARRSSASSATSGSTASAEAPPIAVYVPLEQAPSANGAGVLLVRTRGDPLGARSARPRRDPRAGSRARGLRRRAARRHACRGRLPSAASRCCVLGLLGALALVLAADRRPRRAELHA